MDIIQVLRGAREIAARHWMPFGKRDHDGDLWYLKDGRKLMAKPRTIWRACFDSDSETSNIAYALLEITLDSPLILWEDAPERTKEHVLALFDQAIQDQTPVYDIQTGIEVQHPERFSP